MPIPKKRNRRLIYLAAGGVSLAVWYVIGGRPPAPMYQHNKRIKYHPDPIGYEMIWLVSPGERDRSADELTPIGADQAQSAAERLVSDKKLVGWDGKIYVICSPEEVAIKTALIIASELKSEVSSRLWLAAGHSHGDLMEKLREELDLHLGVKLVVVAPDNKLGQLDCRSMAPGQVRRFDFPIFNSSRGKG